MELRESSSDSEEKVQVKTEPREEDIKGYAEHTMNELLAIYGYEKVDEGVTKELRLHHFSDKDAEREAEAEASNGNLVIKQEVEDETTYGLQPQISDDQINDYHVGDHNPGDSTSQADNHLNSSSGVVISACTSAELGGGDNQPHPKYEIVCAWCQNFGYKRYTLNTATESKPFCSEKCFAACRRAYFRRNKVCDWCRHIRHTKGYIDFQDGDRKLQFCSAKCLHQYKMDVFCQETQALGSAGPSSVDAGPVTEGTNLGNEQPVSGAGNSSDETEQADGMLLSVSADSTQSFVVGNGVHHLTAKQGSDWPVLAARTQPKAKQHPNRTIIGVQHVPIAPKVSVSNVQRQTAAKVIITQAVVSPSVTPPSVTPANALQPRINPVSAGQVFGLQTAILQPAIGATQVVGRTPVVVRGTHWPPVVRQIPGYVVPNQQQQQPLSPIVQPQRHILPAASAKNQSQVTSTGTKKASETSFPSQNFCLPESKTTNNNQSSTLNQVLPPVTVMVPQPVFIPVPYPIPIPIPVPEETFYAMMASLAESSTSNLDANSRINTDGSNPISTLSQHCYDSSQDLEIGRNLSSVFQESAFHKQMDSEQVFGSPLRTPHKRQHAGPLHPVKYPKKELAACPESRHKSWQPYNPLQRSTSMDLSLARSSEDVPYKTVQRASHLDPDTTIRGNVSSQQNTYLTPDVAVHLSGESSAKVREALRCHLTKRLSQSALNLTEVGRLPNPQDDLRRCQSLSRLRSLEPNHMAKLPELTDGYASPRQCSTTQRSNPRDFMEDEDEDEDDEENLIISLDEDPQTPESDDSSEPERKRKCLNHV